MVRVPSPAPPDQSTFLLFQFRSEGRLHRRTSEPFPFFSCLSDPLFVRTIGSASIVKVTGRTNKQRMSRYSVHIGQRTLVQEVSNFGPNHVNRPSPEEIVLIHLKKDQPIERPGGPFEALKVQSGRREASFDFL